MNEQERSEVIIVARLLGAAWPLSMLLAGGSVLATGLLFAGIGMLGATGALVAGLIGIFYSVRVGFDAGLLRESAERQWSGATLDEGFASLGLRGPATVPRPWRSRCRGALRLLAFQGIALVLQVSCLVAGAMLR